MEDKINIAELLHNCPQGMELDCAIFENVVLDEVNFDKDPNYPIRIVTKSGTMLYLSKYGTYIEDTDSKCVIFPKGKTTWEGFVPPCKFKDGDIIFSQFYDLKYIAIVKTIDKSEDIHVYCLYGYTNSVFAIDEILGRLGKNLETRLATKEEKQKLFDAIKENGYYWNPETKELVESKEDTNDKVVMASIYFDREYYDDEVELHLGNYEIEIRDGKTYAIFKNQKTKTMEKLNKPEFKVGDKIKDTRSNSEGIIEKIDEENCTCLFDYGRFYFPITELDYFELVPNKSDITLNMEEINLDWCKQHGMTLFKVNVASDTSYYLETNGYTILVYTISTTGNQKLNVINPITNKEIEFSLSRLNRDLNKLNSITTDDLRKLCELVNLDYPFKS